MGGGKKPLIHCNIYIIENVLSNTNDYPVYAEVLSNIEWIYHNKNKYDR